MDAHGLPLRMLVTADAVADCTQASTLIEGLEAGALLADKGYYPDVILARAQACEMEFVIPPKSNRVMVREYDHELYRLRHWVENAFLHLKRWRGSATRDAKQTAAFLAAVQIHCIALWAAILCRLHPGDFDLKNGIAKADKDYL